MSRFFFASTRANLEYAAIYQKGRYGVAALSQERRKTPQGGENVKR